MFGLWFWLFGKKAEVQENLGGFGSADDRTGGGAETGTGGNNQTLIGGTTNTNPTGNIQTPLYVNPPYRPSTSFQQSSGGTYNAPGVSWLDGSGGNEVFVPTPINQIDDIDIEGTPYFDNTIDDGSGGIGLGGALLGVAGGCILNFLTQKGAAAVGNAGFTVFNSLTSVRTYDQSSDANQTADNLIECITKALARIAIQQITAQTVNWINSGFEGQPAFVQDFEKFFTDVADQAAGEFIQGSDLAFLCSPFQLQVRIAIAQSYARRSAGVSQSCTLSDVVDNVEGFINGDFSQGGWPGLISFTTVPSNNPFGAYVGAQVQLGDKILLDTANAERQISPGGFFSQEKCDPPGSQNCVIVTPGSTIEASLSTALNANIEELQLADSIDEILSALLNSLITNVLQKGLANLSFGTQVTPQDAEAALAAEDLLLELQAAVQRAQQYGSIQQGSIQDVQAAQANLTALQNCWAGKSSSEADDAEGKIAELEVRVGQFNNEITYANTTLTYVQQIQTQALAATNLTEVEAAADAFLQAEATGNLITNTDIINAQQDRTTLQSEMLAVNQQTSVGLSQCYAD